MSISVLALNHTFSILELKGVERVKPKLIFLVQGVVQNHSEF